LTIVPPRRTLAVMTREPAVAADAPGQIASGPALREPSGVDPAEVGDAYPLESRADLARRVRRMEAVQAVAMAAGRGLGVVQVAQVALQRVGELLGAREARMSMLEGDTLRAVVCVRNGYPAPADARIVIATSPADHARVQRAPVQVGVDAADRWPSLRLLEAHGIRHALFVPLEVEEAIFGFLEIYGAAPLSAEDVALAVEAARMVGATMVRERLLEQVARHAETMEMRVALRNEELLRTHEQLIQAAKLSSIGELAAGLVHELNQPLNVLGGYIELLAEGGLDEAGRGRALEVMDRAVTRMTTMVDNLRNFSRGGGPTLAPVELGDVARMAVELTAGSQRHGVTVDSVDGAVVLGDTTRLEQVVINLVANAIQAEGDPVVVKVRYLDADRAFLEVSDRGPGVPDHLRDRIFDAFFTTKPPGQGTGLGLSISARIVQEHGGRIEVDDNPGGGARFRIVLPLYRARELNTS
jgi:signal transduction histidine kinase